MNHKSLILVCTFLLFFSSIFAQENEIDNKENIFTIDTHNFQGQSLEQILSNLLISYVDSGNYAAVKYLIKSYGVDPNSTYEGEDITPLMYASQNGNYKIARFLIDNGAEVNRIPSDGNSAIFAAVRSGNDSIVELLLDNNAIINLKNIDGLTPLHYAVGYGFPYATELLLYYGANPDTLDDDGNSPLMIATYSGAKKCAQLLIDYNVKLDQQDIYGNTPLMVAAQFNDTSLIRLFLEYEVDAFAKNYRNADASEFAIKSGSYESLKQLLDFVDTIKVQSKPNNSYYELANELNVPAIKTLLKEKGYATKLKPSLSSIHLYGGFDFNYSDFMYDYGIGFYEPLTKLQLNGGFKFRPFPARIYELRDYDIYQFWEKRYGLYLSINYLHQVHLTKKSRIGLLTGLSGEYSWSRLRGTDLSKDHKVIAVPNIGFYIKHEYYMIAFKWSIANYHLYNFERNRFGVQLSLSIPTKKNRVVLKQVSWLN